MPKRFKTTRVGIMTRHATNGRFLSKQVTVNQELARELLEQDKIHWDTYYKQYVCWSDQYEQEWSIITWDKKERGQ